MTANRGKFSSERNPNRVLTDAQKRQIDIDRELVRRGGLKAFVRLAWPLVEPGQAFLPNWHIDAIAEHLEAVYNGQIRQLLINVPPACMKSRMTCVFGPTFSWLTQPSLYFVFTSFDEDLTFRDNQDSLSLMQSQWFRDRWGDIVSVSDTTAVGHYRNARGGQRFATSIKGKLTGHHPDILVIDDPQKPGDITDVGLANVRDWWSKTASTRGRNPETVKRICIMQRLHENDLAGYFIERGGWEHLCLPMKFETKARSVTSIWQDPRTEEGELLWPSRFSAAAVREKEIDLTPLHAAAQLQQRPSPEGGNVFQREWFQFYDPAELPKMPFDRIIQSWDCTFKDHDRTDFVVGQVWGKRGSDFFLLDEVRKQMNFPATQAAILAMKNRWNRASAILIEDKANGPALESVLKHKLPGVILVDPRGGKYARANSVSSYFEAQNVYHPNPEYKRPDGFKPYEWVLEHLEELATFPTGKYDDRVDCLSQALIYLGEKKGSLVAAMNSLKRGPNPFGPKGAIGGRSI